MAVGLNIRWIAGGEAKGVVCVGWQRRPRQRYYSRPLDERGTLASPAAVAEKKEAQQALSKSPVGQRPGEFWWACCGGLCVRRRRARAPVPLAKHTWLLSSSS